MLETNLLRWLIYLIDPVVDNLFQYGKQGCFESSEIGSYQKLREIFYPATEILYVESSRKKTLKTVVRQLVNDK